MAEDERQRIIKRTNDSRTAARKRGTKFCLKPKLTDHQQDVAMKCFEVGESCRAIASLLGGSQSSPAAAPSVRAAWCRKSDSGGSRYFKMYPSTRNVVYRGDVTLRATLENKVQREKASSCSAATQPLFSMQADLQSSFERYGVDSINSP
jgi:hypothetical protein